MGLIRSASAAKVGDSYAPGPVLCPCRLPESPCNGTSMAVHFSPSFVYVARPMYPAADGHDQETEDGLPPS